MTDSKSNVTSNSFDHLNRLTAETDANSNSAAYSYDLAGELNSKTDKNGRVSNFAYDRDLRLTQEQWISGGSVIEESAIHQFAVVWGMWAPSAPGPTTAALSQLQNAGNHLIAAAITACGPDRFEPTPNNGWQPPHLRPLSRKGERGVRITRRGRYGASEAVPATRRDPSLPNSASERRLRRFRRHGPAAHFPLGKEHMA